GDPEGLAVAGVERVERRRRTRGAEDERGVTGGSAAVGALALRGAPVALTLRTRVALRLGAGREDQGERGDRRQRSNLAVLHRASSRLSAGHVGPAPTKPITPRGRWEGLGPSRDGTVMCGD